LSLFYGVRQLAAAIFCDSSLSLSLYHASLLDSLYEKLPPLYRSAYHRRQQAVALTKRRQASALHSYEDRHKAYPYHCCPDWAFTKFETHSREADSVACFGRTVTPIPTSDG
ncbi:MAG: hypothetical protein ACUVTH_13755, partial [Thermogutta sp.]